MKDLREIYQESLASMEKEFATNHPVALKVLKGAAIGGAGLMLAHSAKGTFDAFKFARENTKTIEAIRKLYGLSKKWTPEQVLEYEHYMAKARDTHNAFKGALKPEIGGHLPTI